MQLVSADRKLLKAFYTQYTAVLLIILTFTIGAFQRTIQAELSINSIPVWAPRATVGSLEISGVFTSEGELDPSAPQLNAIAEVLTQHDLNVRVVMSVADLGLREYSTSLRRAGIRLEKLRKFFLSRGVPESALVLATRLNESNVDTIRVEFIEAEG
jgi:hypothetical protein